jgi:Protein of unknown function (DUF3168)
MSGELVARDAIITLLRADSGLAALVNQVADGDPGKASAPWLRVGDASTNGWGARGVDGRTLRLPIQLNVRGDQITQVAAIIDQVDTIIRDADPALGAWRITLLRLERSRISRTQAGWGVTMDYALRIARLS